MDRDTARQATYQPLVLLLVAASIGIALDRLQLAGPVVWLTSGAAALAVWLAAWRGHRAGLSTIALLIAVSCVAGFWHHARWNWFGPTDLGLFLRSQPTPICIEGRARSQPQWIAPPDDAEMNAIPRGVQSRLPVWAQRIRSGQNWQAISGDIEIVVDGQLEGIANGDRVRVFGESLAPGIPSNPGQLDVYWQRRRTGQLGLIRATHVDCVQLLSDQPSQGSGRWVSGFRGRLDEMIWAYVDPQRASLASAILLGNRDQLNRQQREKFLVSGTFHLLAISGLHVGILAGGIFFLARLGLLPRQHCLIVVIAFVIGYAWLVEFRAPVVRAAVLISVFCISRWIGRGGFSFNVLALAALIVLAINPGELFSAGAQLSFLAVATLTLSQRLLFPRPSTDPLQRLIDNSRPYPQRVLRSTGRKVRTAFLASGLIWLLALPLVAEKFHIVAPVALVANPLLLIPISSALLFGFAVITLGWIMPSMAQLCGLACDGSLAVVQQVIDVADRVPGSHFWTCGPAPAMVVVFYLGLALMVAYPPTRIPPRWMAALALLWLALACLPGWRSDSTSKGTPQLQCTFIDVGHGTSVLVQLPGGKHLLYDCGSFASASRAEHLICGVLWQQRVQHLDAVVISHADADHFNGIAGILERFSVGCIYLSPVMLRKTEYPLTDRIVQLARRHGVPVETLCRHDQLVTGDSSIIRVRGPPREGTGDSDNSDSIVLELQFQGRRILLPGDLEKTGLQLLMAQSQVACDLAMAPHHGSRLSNPQEYLNWCRPSILVVSGGEGDYDPTLEMSCALRGIGFYHTARVGAIQIGIDAGGVYVDTWKKNSRPSAPARLETN